MKKTKDEGVAAKGKAATEAVDEDKLYSFNYDEQMSVRESRPWKKDPKCAFLPPPFSSLRD